MKHLDFYALIFRVICLLVFILTPASTLSQEPIDYEGHRQIVQYLTETRLVDQLDKVTIWTTPFALDTTYVIKNMIKEKKQDIRVPFVKFWLVMIDDNPDANFGHPVRWVFIDEKFKKHSEIIKEEFPPVVISDYGKGKPVLFKCWDLTPRSCDLIEEFRPSVIQKRVKISSCKYAILVSGGVNSASNYSRYAQNLKSMYTMLRSAGYPKSHIYVYYADGNTALDCDNADGDNNDATGSDVTDGAFESSIRARYQSLSATWRCRVLFSYFTNHGADNTGVCLWDDEGDGLDSEELYSPDELSSDIANTKFCRHFMIHDQCYSGDYLPVATDGNHKKLVVYAAASATELSWGREYMARWEQNSITTTTVNAMHQDVVSNGNLTSTPGISEGTTDIGNYLASKCCCCWWWWRYWYIIIPVILLFSIVVIIIIRRRKNHL